MKCPYCSKEFKAPGSVLGGQRSRRDITPEQQLEMQAGVIYTREQRRAAKAAAAAVAVAKAEAEAEVIAEHEAAMALYAEHKAAEAKAAADEEAAEAKAAADEETEQWVEGTDRG